MAYVNPEAAAFKAYFDRDFPYAIDQADMTKVRDLDITRAINDSEIQINDCLFSTQAEYTTAFLYLSAHYLCFNLQSSSQGINGAFPWITQSKSVGSVSESFITPDKIKDNPYYSFLCSTRYGANYLMMIISRLIGNVGINYGTTTAA